MQELENHHIRYPIMENTEKEVWSKVEFPAVSVCLNSPVRWMNRSTEPGRSFVEKTMKVFQMENHPLYRTLSNDEYDHREMALLEEMAKLNQSDRVSFGYPIGMFVIKCSWQGTDCKPDLYLFNNLHYGTCFTFNPGFSEDQVLQAAKSTSLMMLLRSDFPDEFPYVRRDDVIFLSLHSSGVAPILDRRRMHSLFPGRWLKIGITETSEFIRLPSPYPSKCVEENDPEIQKKSFYFSAETPYRYSVEACADACFQNATMNSCNCIVPIYPLPQGHPVNICRIDECSTKNDEIKCDCPKPCREIQHQYQVSIDDRWLTQGIWVDWVNTLLTEENNMSLNVRRVCGFEVYVSSTMHSVVQEEQKILVLAVMCTFNTRAKNFSNYL